MLGVPDLESVEPGLGVGHDLIQAPAEPGVREHRGPARLVDPGDGLGGTGARFGNVAGRPRAKVPPERVVDRAGRSQADQSQGEMRASQGSLRGVGQNVGPNDADAGLPQPIEHGVHPLRALVGKVLESRAEPRVIGVDEEAEHVDVGSLFSRAHLHAGNGEKPVRGGAERRESVEAVMIGEGHGGQPGLPGETGEFLG